MPCYYGLWKVDKQQTTAQKFAIECRKNVCALEAIDVRMLTCGSLYGGRGRGRTFVDFLLPFCWGFREIFQKARHFYGCENCGKLENNRRFRSHFMSGSVRHALRASFFGILEQS